MAVVEKTKQLCLVMVKLIFPEKMYKAHNEINGVVQTLFRSLGIIFSHSLACWHVSSIFTFLSHVCGWLVCLWGGCCCGGFFCFFVWVFFHKNTVVLQENIAFNFGKISLCLVF